MRLIDADALYAKLQEYEELARKRVWDTASTIPFPTNLNPSYTRYLAQLDERTALKHMVADAPTVEQPEIIHCRDCKHWREDHTCREHSLVSPMMAYEFCSRAERREE